MLRLVLWIFKVAALNTTPICCPHYGTGFMATLCELARTEQACVSGFKQSGLAFLSINHFRLLLFDSPFIQVVVYMQCFNCFLIIPPPSTPIIFLGSSLFTRMSGFHSRYVSSEMTDEVLCSWGLKFMMGSIGGSLRNGLFPLPFTQNFFVLLRHCSQYQILLRHEPGNLCSQRGYCIILNRCVFQHLFGAMRPVWHGPNVIHLVKLVTYFQCSKHQARLWI